MGLPGITEEVLLGGWWFVGGNKTKTKARGDDRGWRETWMMKEKGQGQERQEQPLSATVCCLPRFD